MDREAIARRLRRRQIQEALDEEQGREAALVEQLEELVVEEEGARVDEEAFARMEPGDVELVRDVLAIALPFDDEEDEADPLADDPEELDGRGLEDEIDRLREEIAGSQSKQRAYARYLDALGDV